MTCYGNGFCRNCEDIAMSFLVANATAAAPIWVKGEHHCLMYILTSAFLLSLIVLCNLSFLIEFANVHSIVLEAF